ncbi:PREDICTED: DNA-3-methyladenine glycosylase 1-like [Papilio xuthus]|uniref:DNA-3-methyladenine glycosylase 1-like n=1 Tax=Papilio xuthus TaxID=66420 RepID=A0AAJ6Z819_PAPXU|nr:PREDICTED: DNA-3-methyladenine glycosylase 1-like [Papilio xuthus]
MPQSEIKTSGEIVRCGWVTKDPQYIEYHDSEWGEPVYDNYQLFEMLCLEGQQAGLSWITILKKREKYKQSFHNFNPNKISKMSETAILKLLNDPGIVRHKGKLIAIKHNSDCYLAMENNGEDFSNFIWSFVQHRPIINNWENVKDVPTETDISKALSKALKKRGFKFVGSTICYAFMQACGLVNDHIVSCYCRNRDDILLD